MYIDLFEDKSIMNSNGRNITLRKEDGEIYCNEFRAKSNLIVDGVIKTRTAKMITIPNTLTTTGIVEVEGVVSSSGGGTAPGMASFTGLIGAGPEISLGPDGKFKRVNIFCLDEETGLRNGEYLSNTPAVAQVVKLSN